jgi:ribosome-binding factor A
MSERTARLDELLREEISEVVRREIDDPRIGFVTITDVETSPDLRHANVWVSIIGSAEERKQALRALSHAMPYVRGRLGKLRLKRIPDLHVKEDDSAERGTRVLKILDDLEQGGEGEVGEIEETLPTPAGISAVEHVAGPPKPRKRGRWTAPTKSSKPKASKAKGHR